MKKSINEVTIIGSGVMGGGIAVLLTGAGLRVNLLDIVPPALGDDDIKKGLTTESKAFRNKFASTSLKNLKKSFYDQSLADNIYVGNIEDDLDKITSSDWVIEVVVERLDIKQNVFKTIAAARTPGTIVSTNTSGLSVNEICKGFDDEFRAHFLGTHFFNPPRFMKLFEVIPANDTLPEVLEIMETFAVNELGKGVVVAKDTPNFIGNRIGTYASVIGMKHMTEFGLNVVEVDNLTGPALGRPKTATFKTMDLVGIDIFGHVSHTMTSAFDGEEGQLFELPGFVKTLLDKKFLGNKTRQGFYKKDKALGNLVWDIAKEDYVPVEKVSTDLAKTALKSANKYETMVYDDSNEGKYCWAIMRDTLIYSAEKVPEITEDFKAIDDAMRWGYNWELGPFQIWDKIGLTKSIERMEAEGFTVPAWVKEVAQKDGKFYAAQGAKSPYISRDNVIKSSSDARLIDLGDGIVMIEPNTKNNVVTPGYFQFISDNLEEICANYKGLVMGASGANYGFGADLTYMAQSIEKNDFSTIKPLLKLFQETVLALKYCDIPVIGAPFKSALGGCLEVVLHTDKVVAPAETYMGLVEMGVGLIPGAGGSTELLYRGLVGKDRASLHERNAITEKVWKLVSNAAVSSSGFNAKTIGYLRDTDRIIMNEDALIDEAKKEALHLASNNYKAPAKRNIHVVGKEGKATIMYTLNAMRDGGYISEYDKFLSERLAYLLTGGDLATGQMVSEEYLLGVEAEVFFSLIQNPLTQDRIKHMLTTGKALRN